MYIDKLTEEEKETFNKAFDSLTNILEKVSTKLAPHENAELRTAVVSVMREKSKLDRILITKNINQYNRNMVSSIGMRESILEGLSDKGLGEIEFIKRESAMKASIDTLQFEQKAMQKFINLFINKEE